mmetsp:Transcript_1897/g.4618  ORF Transcript_1897/g.4618 Transcript_1897/m.4618 type:complete len:1000 (+) Transcript_1897:220-3219(+)
MGKTAPRKLTVRKNSPGRQKERVEPASRPAPGGEGQFRPLGPTSTAPDIITPPPPPPPQAARGEHSTPPSVQREQPPRGGWPSERGPPSMEGPEPIRERACIPMRHSPLAVWGRLDGATVEDSVTVVDRHEEVGKHNGDDGHELHHDVERGARGVLEGVANGVPNNGAGVCGRLLASVKALAAIDCDNGLVTHHDANVPALVRLLDVSEPLLHGDLPLAVAHADLLLHRRVAVVPLGRVPPLKVVDGPSVPERKPSVELTLLSVLLGIVPRAARVGHGDGELHRGGDGAREEASDRLNASKGADEDGREDDEDTGGDHLAEGGLGGDGDASLVVGLDKLLALSDVLGTLVEVHAGRIGEALDVGKLAGNLEHHGVGGLADGAHGEGREPVGDHGAKDDEGEDHGGEEVDALDDERVVGGHGGRGAGDEGTEEGKRHKRGGADGKPLADGGRGVAGGVEGIGLVADLAGELSHLGDATGVVGDGAVDVNGEAGGQGGEHAEGGEGDAVHAAHLDAGEHDEGDDDDGEDHTLVPKGKAVDNVGSGACLSCACDLTDGGVGVGGVVFGDEADEATAPKARHDAEIAHEGRHRVGDAVEAHLRGKGPLRDGVEAKSHDDTGEAQLDLQGLLDVLLAANGLEICRDEGAEEAGEDADRRDEEGVREGEPAGLLDGDARGADEHGGARRLSEGAEEIRPHASNVTDIVPDIVGDARGVERRVLVQLLAVTHTDDLAREVSSHVGRLGEDPAAHAPEHGDRGAAEAVAGEALEEHLVVDPGLALVVNDAEVAPVEDSQHVEHHHRDRAQREPHHPAGAERGVERGHPPRLALLLGGDGSAGVCVHSNHHADEARQDRSEPTNHKRHSRQPTGIKVPRGALGAVGVRHQSKDDKGEASDEDETDLVLRPQEGAGAGADRLVDRLELVIRSARGGEEGLRVAALAATKRDAGDDEEEEAREADPDDPAGVDEGVSRGLGLGVKVLLVIRGDCAVGCRKGRSSEKAEEQ